MSSGATGYQMAGLLLIASEQILHCMLWDCGFMTPVALTCRNLEHWVEAALRCSVKSSGKSLINTCTVTEQVAVNHSPAARLLPTGYCCSRPQTV
jgi:hypothetical protein